MGETIISNLSLIKMNFDFLKKNGFCRRVYSDRKKVYSDLISDEVHYIKKGKEIIVYTSFEVANEDFIMSRSLVQTNNGNRHAIADKIFKASYWRAVIMFHDKITNDDIFKAGIFLSNELTVLEKDIAACSHSLKGELETYGAFIQKRTEVVNRWCGD
ncbi:MAG: hypothetical protein LBQ40_05720 [Clostridiales bacterium]|jgi:hypothetical protein|nr:hypothetical protein [Clostridiales bacterium]